MDSIAGYRFFATDGDPRWWRPQRPLNTPRLEIDDLAARRIAQKCRAEALAAAAIHANHPGK
jgi:hypothetical protein